MRFGGEFVGSLVFTINRPICKITKVYHHMQKRLWIVVSAVVMHRALREGDDFTMSQNSN
jgi:hypothetical protein